MTEKKLKYRVGLTIIVLNLAIVVTIVTLRLLGGFDPAQFTTLLSVVVPMFSGYTTSVVAFVVADRHSMTDETPPVTGAFAALSFVFPLIFAGLVLSAVVLQAFNRAFEDFEDFKSYLLAIESIFAVYMGYFIYSMFKKVETDP